MRTHHLVRLLLLHEQEERTMIKLIIIPVAMFSLSAFAQTTTEPVGVTKSTTTPANPNDSFQCVVDNVVTTKMTQVDCEEAGGTWNKSLNPAKPNIDKNVRRIESDATPEAPETK